MSNEAQQQRQQQLQQQHAKSPKDATTVSATTAPTPPRKTNIHELRNQDYISRLMAATPPYLYSAPVGPNNFFFSDMLRSLVQARNNENARNLQLQQSVVLARRPRKRSWSQHRPYYEHLRERKDLEEKPQLASNAVTALNAEKPLELTNKPFFHMANKYRKAEEPTKELEAKSPTETKSTEFEQAEHSNANNESNGGAVDGLPQDTPPAASLPPQDLVLPPPPPVWYPPLYPPYGIDPLHFFIDLRVSGHIYDRKKENISPLTSAENTSSTSTNDGERASTPPSITLPNKHRHGSAFTVPVPRSNDGSKLAASHTPLDAINLSSAAATNKFEHYAKYYDLGETKENQPISKSNANYMLQQLPRLYSQFAARDLIASTQSDNKSEPDCDADSDGRNSADNCTESTTNRERDIDVEIIDSIKYRTDGESSRCSSADEASVTQID